VELAVFNVARRCRRERKKMNKRRCKKTTGLLVTLKRKRLARLRSSKLLWVRLAMTYEMRSLIVPISYSNGASKNDNYSYTKQSLQVLNRGLSRRKRFSIDRH